VHDETVRVNAVNADLLAGHRTAVLGFLKAYKKSIDWAFSGEPAVGAYAKLSDPPLDVAKYIVKEFASKATAQLDEIKGRGQCTRRGAGGKAHTHLLTRKDIKGVYDFGLEARLLNMEKETEQRSHHSAAASTHEFFLVIRTNCSSACKLDHKRMLSR
jgi:hypothetical protein